MKLIDNWKQSYKLKSVQVGALSAIFFALCLLSEQFIHIWTVIPDDLKTHIPEAWKEYVGLVVGVAMVLARLKKQNSLHSDEQLIQPLIAVPKIGLSKKGFDFVREKLFKGKLTQVHVDNINAILNAVSKYEIGDLQ